MKKNIEFRTGVPHWGTEGEREVFSCVGDLKSYVDGIIKHSGKTMSSISGDLYLSVFTQIDKSSKDVKFSEDGVKFIRDAVLVYSGDVEKLVKDIQKLGENTDNFKE